MLATEGPVQTPPVKMHEEDGWAEVGDTKVQRAGTGATTVAWNSVWSARKRFHKAS